jgi:WD40 repeat protein
MLVDRCCLCKRDGESVDHLLPHCDVASVLWNNIFICFSMFWVMPRRVIDLFACWLYLLLSNSFVNHVYFSPEGQWVASASFDKSVKLWSGATGKFIAAFRGHVGPVYHLRFELFPWFM